MNKLAVGAVYNAAGNAALLLAGNDTVTLWSGGETVAPVALFAGGNSITGGNGGYNVVLAGGHDTVSLGNGNDTIVGGVSPSQAMDQQIVVGGLQGFADLADPRNTATLLSTGRVSEYLHWAALIDASTGKLLVPGAQASLAQIAAMQAVFAKSTGPLAELNYDANPQQYFSGLYTSDYTALGFHPINANVNMFDLWRGAGGVAAWDAYVNQARAHGLRTVAPIYSPNDVAGSYAWSDTVFDPVRAMALYGGAIAIDAPPSFFFALGTTYQNFIEDEIKWGVARGLRVSVIVSPYTGNTTYLADAQAFVHTLVAAGAVPTQWVAENYDVPVPAGYPNRLGSENQPNTVDNVALWLAQNAPTATLPSAGDNAFTVGNGNDRIALAPYDTLVAGAGFDTITSAGNARIAIGGGGGRLGLGQHDALTVTAGNYGIALGGGDSVAVLAGGVTIQGGAGAADTVGVAAGAATVYGGAAALSVTGGAGSVAVFLGAGGGVVQGGSAGGNWLSADSGAATLSGGGAGDTIDGGSGAVTITTAASGGADVVLGAGAASVTLHPGDTLVGGAGSATVAGAGMAGAGMAGAGMAGAGMASAGMAGSAPLAGDTVVLGSGSLSLNLGSGNFISAGGSQDRVVAAPAGNNTISGAGGTGAAQFSGGTGFDVLYAGNGKDVLSLGSGGGQEWAGAGNATLIGGSGAATMTGGGGFTDFVAQQGSVQITAGSGPALINTGTGAAVVHLQYGQDTVHFGAGTATVYAGAGADVYDLTGAAANDVVWGFKQGVDTLRVDGGVTVASERYGTGAVVVTLSDGATILIYGAGLNASHLPVIAP